ncbi:MAG: FKBP-type peptidyl-prolyl cis-trans isomerase [Candidatus Aminicenantales bacterium]
MRKAKAVTGVCGSIILLLAAGITAFSQEDREIGKEYVTASGLKYTIVALGNGPKAETGKEICLHGIGSFPDGKIFWNSRDPNDPFYFVLGVDRVIKGCSEGVALMRVGDRFIFTLSPELGYGEKGSGSAIPPNAILIFDYEILSVEAPKTPIAATLYQIINEKGISQAVSTYLWLKKDKSAEYNFREDQLNTLGYKLLADRKIKEAVAILELNAAAYPESANAYDSLGEAYLADEQKDKAVENYEKSLKLNPKNENAAEMLKKIKG